MPVRRLAVRGGWELDLGGNQNPAELPINDNKTVAAFFQEIPPAIYTLTLTTSGNGTVAVNDVEYTDPMPFEEGTTIHLTASPGEGWEFEGWEGDLSGNDNPTTLVMDKDKFVEAHFLEIPPATFTLTIATTGNGKVLVNGDAYTAPLVFEEGETPNIEAVADDGWRFEGWLGDLDGNENPTNLLIDSDKEITALFEEIPPVTHWLTIVVLGQGKVLVDGVEYTSEMSIEEGTTVEIEAVPEEGWLFQSWNSDLTGNNNPETLLIDADKIVDVRFERQEHTLTLATSGNGIVLVNGKIYASPIPLFHNEVAVLEAVPATNWYFHEWAGDHEGNENPVSITINSDKSIHAGFLEEPPTIYTLTLTIEGNGKIFVNDEEYSQPLGFEEGTPVMLRAEPGEGHQFDGWSGDLTSTDISQALLVDNDKEVVATFSLKQYTLTIQVEGNGEVSVDGTPYEDPITFNHGDNPLLLATPGEGWQFDGWSGDLTSDQPEERVGMETDKSITATFSLIPEPLFSIRFVVGKEDSTPISDAVVTLNDTAYPPGKYLFEDLASGTYDYIVSAEGYFQKTGTIELINVDVVETVVLEIDNTSIRNLSKKQIFSVYPIPTDRYLSISSNDYIEEIKLINLTGQTLLMKSNFRDKSYTLDVSTIPGGIYVLQIKSTVGFESRQIKIMNR